MSLFDRSFPTEITTAVPIRELSRSPARLIDRVEREGEVIALHRYGRIVAVLAPVPEKMVLRIESEPPPARAPVEGIDAVIPEWLDADETAQSLLLHALTSHPMPYSVDAAGLPFPDVLAAKTRLELGDFADQTRRGNFLTPLGVAAARVLQRRLDSENGSPAS